jgi:hypothetical protein
MTTHWVHQLPTVGVDKHIIIYPKTWANHYTQSASWVSVAFPEAMGREEWFTWWWCHTDGSVTIIATMAGISGLAFWNNVVEVEEKLQKFLRKLKGENWEE